MTVPRLGDWNKEWKQGQQFFSCVPASRADFLNLCISDTLIQNKDQICEDMEDQFVWL